MLTVCSRQGDSKFIPRLPSASIEALAKTSPETEKLWSAVKDHLYQSSPMSKMHLGYPDQGHVSAYYLDTPENPITTEEITITSDFIKETGLMPENTR
jgi:dipeptidyl-peptidase-3